MYYVDMVIDAFDLPSAPGADPNTIIFQVRVLGSPAGEQSSVGAIAGSFDRKLLQDAVRQLEARALVGDALIAFGRQLADWLLPRAPAGGVGVRDLYERSLAQAGQDGGLRLRLQLAPALAWVPWEYVYIDSLGGDGRQSGMEGFLALNPRVALVRYEPLPLAVPKVQPPADARLKVVGAMALRADAQQLDLGAERAALEQIFSVKGVEHEFVEQSTLQDILAQSFDAHIFHFAGHGEFQMDMGDRPRTFVGTGSVQLADAAVDAEQLSMNIRGNSLRLAVLGACESGKRGGVNVINPWDAIVPTLARFGVPAVVANQFTILDDCAIEFSKAFYSALFGGLSIERAVVAGRLAIYNANKDGREWGVPVLYMRAPDGQLFNGVADPAARKQARAAAEQIINPQLALFDSQVGTLVAGPIDSSGGTINLGPTTNTTIYNTVQAAETELTPSPPPPPPHYVTREQLEEELRAALLAAGDLAPVVILWGSDGVGKGALAARVAGVMFDEREFPGGVAWVDHADRTSEELLRGVLAMLGSRWAKQAAPLWPTLEERQHRTLVVVDNVRDAKQLRQLLPAAPVRPTRSRLLVISDFKFDGDRNLVSGQVHVGPFEPEQSLRLFEHVLNKKDVVQKYHDDLLQIGDFYTHLPPLISSAAQRIAESKLNPAAFLRQLKEHESQQDALGEALLQARELLIHDLPPIQVELFALTCLFGEGNWSAEMLAAVALCPLQDVREALSVLVQRQLLAADPGGRYRVQSLFRPIAQHRFEARTPYERAAACRLLARWCLDRAEDVSLELRSGNLKPSDRQGEAKEDFFREFRDTLRPEMPHIRKVLEWAADNAAWDILDRFAKLSYMELVRRLIWNYPIGYINLQLATIEQLIIGPYDPQQPSLHVFLPNDGLLGYLDSARTPHLEPDNTEAGAKIRPLLRHATSEKSELHFSLVAGKIDDGIISGADLVSCKWFGVQAPGIIWVDVHMVGARLLACDLPLSVWRDCDASRAMFAGSDLRYTAWKQVKLRGADLRNVDLTGAVLDGVDLRDADLRGANLTGTYLREVNFLNARLDQVIWAGAQVSRDSEGDDSLVLDPAAREEFQRAVDLVPSVPPAQLYSGAPAQRDLVGVTSEITGGDYRYWDLRAVNLARVQIGRSNFENADFRAARLDDATLFRMRLAGALFGAARLEGVQIVRANMQRANLYAAQMRNTHIAGVDLREAQLRAAHMVDMFMFRANLSQADLYAVNLLNATICKTDLHEADLRSANLSRLSLLWADLTGALVSEEQLRSLYGLRGSILPDGSLYTGRFNLPGDLNDAQQLGIDTSDTAAMERFYRDSAKLASAEVVALNYFIPYLSNSFQDEFEKITSRVQRLSQPAQTEHANPQQLIDICNELQQIVGELRPLMQSTVVWTFIESIVWLVIDEAGVRIQQALFASLGQQITGDRKWRAAEKRQLQSALQKVQKEIDRGDDANKAHLLRALRALAGAPDLLWVLVRYLMEPLLQCSQKVTEAAWVVFCELAQTRAEQSQAPREVQRAAGEAIDLLQDWGLQGGADDGQSADELVAALAKLAIKAPGSLELAEQMLALPPDGWVGEFVAKALAQASAPE